MGTVLKIDRSSSFNPGSLRGLKKDWIIEEEDTLSLSLSEVDLSRVCLETCLRGVELRIENIEKLRRLKELNCIKLDIKIFQALWGNKKLIPGKWKEKIKGRTVFIFFEGTKFLAPDSRCYVLCFFWSGVRWRYSFVSCEGSRGFNDPSATIISSINAS